MKKLTVRQFNQTIARSNDEWAKFDKNRDDWVEEVRERKDAWVLGEGTKIVLACRKR